ncbi:MAG: hypothetical protein ABGW90_00325 [Martelella sp.]
MRFSVSAILILVTLAVFGPLPALAQGSAAEDQASEMPDVVVEADPLDRLYDRLKRTSDARQAADLARQIDEYLDRSPSATVSLLIEWSDDSENNGRTAAALDFLSEAIALRPDEAAPYRKRAVLHYTHGDLERAMDDIRTSLSLEPRDFGALGLMATILDRTGRQEAAVAVWRRYLEFYPADRDVAAFVESTLNERAGKRI